MPLDSSTSQPSPTPFLNDFHVSIDPQPSISTAGADPTFQEGSDTHDGFNVSWDDPTWKVLPAMLKKYRHNNHYQDDNWENFAMLIRYGPPSNRTIRCLNFDEKPLLVFQLLRDAEKNPVFVLKHVKDIPSPITAAQRRRTISERASAEMKSEDPIGGLDSVSLSAAPVDGAQSPVDNLRSLLSTIIPGGAKREMPPPLAKVSYAIAIYPYVAEQEDEIDVSVGDTFVIISRLYDWLVVQRDPTGAGLVRTDTSVQRWAPDGCFLETIIPVASAITEAMASTALNVGSRAPIFPTRIISSSFPGIALMDYKAKGDEEINLMTGDAVRIFKLYNYWSYVRHSLHQCLLYPDQCVGC
ncbi:hypothetical protein J3A83DRAFT_1433499 [Scleroderma citrinum]